MKANPSRAPQTATAAERTAVWSAQTRRLVIVGIVIAGVIVVYWIRDTLDTLILAVLAAYLLNPLVAGLHRWLRLPRIAAAALIYLTLVALLVGASVTLAPMLFRQVGTLGGDLDQIVAQASKALAPLGVSLDAGSLTERLRAELASLSAQVPRVLVGAASSAFSLVFVLVMSFYLVKDADKIQRNLTNSAPEEYRDDVQRILRELDDIWSSFLRGQVMLALIIGVVTTLALLALGVRNALLLGLLAGVLEVVPTIGPIISMVPSVLSAFFQGSTLWALDNTVFALIVVVTYILIQQLENHLVVPNVLGRSVNLPAVVVLFGALAGASLAGVLGIFLAAPVLATGRLLLQYVVRKLLEPPTFTNS